MIYAIRIVQLDLGRENVMGTMPWKMQIQRVWFRYNGADFEYGLHPWEDVPVISEPAPVPEQCREAQPSDHPSRGGSS